MAVVHTCIFTRQYWYSAHAAESSTTQSLSAQELSVTVGDKTMRLGSLKLLAMLLAYSVHSPVASLGGGTDRPG